MRVLPETMAVALLWAGTALAHEHWIMAERNGDHATVRIGSGHGFPISEILLAERLLADMTATGPGGAVTAFKPTAAGKTWTAEVPVARPGVWVFSFALKKPQEDEALYRGRCLLVVGNADAPPTRYATGRGLEIVLMAPLSALKPGDSLSAAIHLDGNPVEGKIAVIPERGTVSFLSTGRTRPADIRLPSAGACLLTASHKGRTFALTLSVAAPAEGATP